MVEVGFVKADSRNLPKIDVFMVAEFIKNDDRFNAAEMRLVKASLSSGENYGDIAIGYVCLKRETSRCIVKGKICPEHRVRSKNYSVQVIVNTENETIEEAACQDCVASLGGCKNSLAFLMWIHRKSEEASPTEVQCYWNKPILATVRTASKLLTVNDMCNKSVSNEAENIEESSQLLKNIILRKAEEKQLNSSLSTHNFVLKDRECWNLSLHQLFAQFMESGKSDVNEFLDYAHSHCTKDMCAKIRKETKEQSNNLLWHELRYGRITASILHEAAHCKTNDGSLLQKLLGASKKFDTIAIERGRNLESDVIVQVEKILQLKLEKCGLIIIPHLPVFGASADALGKDFVCEERIILCSRSKF